MSLRRTDLRLVLPEPARTAAVLGDLGAWQAGLAAAGVETASGSNPADLAVAPGALARRAAAAGSPAVLLEGRRGAGVLQRAGYAVRRFLVLPDLDHPSLVLPLAPGGAARYALETWRPAHTAGKRFRNRAVGTLVESGVYPPVRMETVLGLRHPGPPYAIADAGAFGVPPESAWFIALGQGDPLARVAFYLLPPTAAEPAWVLKLARLPGVRDSFDRDEHGLGLAAAAGGTASAHAPTLIGRFDTHGLQASLESAARGEQLSSLIARDRATARRSIDEIAAWIVRISTETAELPDGLADERNRLQTEVLPHWLEGGAQADLVSRLPELRGVLQHNDLGTWNIVVRPGGFVAVDWESARRPGLPLWDLLYFLVDALPLLEGSTTSEQRVTEALRILRGESASSPILFDWLRRGVASAGVPEEAVGPLATLCWLHHGLSHVPRQAAADNAEPGSSADPSPIDLLAPRWLLDPALGPTWNAWRR